MSEVLHQGPCPACPSSDAYTVYEDHGHCYSCGYHRHLSENQILERPTPSGEPIHKEGAQFRDLPSRGLYAETLRKYGYGLITLGGEPAHAAPYHDSRGRVIAHHIRKRGKQFSWSGDASRVVLFGQHLFKGGKHLVITEGEIDCLTMSQIQGNRYPVVSVPNGAQLAAKAIRRSLDWLEGFERIVLFFDQDEPGQEAALECAALLRPGQAAIARFDGKDPNELLLDGRSEDLIRAFWDAPTYRPDGLLEGSDVWAKVEGSPPPKAAAWPWPTLQAMTGGLRRAEITTLAAGIGSGKSTACREVAYDLVRQGQKVGYVGLEEALDETVLGLLTPAVSRNLLFEREVDWHSLKPQWDEIAKGFVLLDHNGSLSPENLVNQSRYLSVGMDCDYLILDHLSIIINSSAGGDERRNIDGVMKSLASLTKETGVGIVLVSHLRRPSDGAHEEGRGVSMSDLRGSGMIAGLSHNIIAIERDQREEESLVTMRVLKCRRGRTGVAGHLRYDYETGRLTEAESYFE